MGLSGFGGSESRWPLVMVLQVRGPPFDWSPFWLNFSPVNPKKDSENTPVKGGTVADLGKNCVVFLLFFLNDTCFLFPVAEAALLTEPVARPDHRVAAIFQRDSFPSGPLFFTRSQREGILKETAKRAVPLIAAASSGGAFEKWLCG